MLFLIYSHFHTPTYLFSHYGLTFYQSVVNSGHYLVHDCADNALNTVAFSMPCKGIEKTALRLDPYIPYLIATNLSCNAIYIS